MADKPVVFITGCSNGGIGAAFANTFAAKDFTVYATSRSLETMSELSHPNIIKLAVDVTDETSVNAAVGEIYEKSGKIDIVISNAGVGCTAPLLDVPLSRSQDVFNANFFGLVRVVHAVVPRMAERKKGLVVSIGSIRGELTTPFTGIYSSSKAALHAYTEALSMECQPLGIDVMLISPGSITSNIVNNQKQFTALPETSLYKQFSKQIENIRNQSQSKEYGSMNATDFAKQAVDKMLAKRPPKYLTLGGSTRLFSFLKWLPRQWALALIWRALSKSK